MAASLVFDEGLAHGGQKGMLAGINAALAKHDPKAARRRKANSSAVRGQIGMLRQVRDELLAEELLRRVRLKKKREQAAERQRNRRLRLSRKNA